MAIVDLIQRWISPEGVIAMGVVATAIQQQYGRIRQRRMAADIKELAINTNSIQTALNESKVAEGRILEREDARVREDTGKSL